jgi:TolB protein
MSGAVPGFRHGARLARVTRRFSLLLVLLAAPLYGAPVGVFTQAGNVGQVAKPVDARFDSLLGAYVIGAGGANIWDAQDAFGFAWKEVRGDLALAARIELQGTSAQPHRKAGIMFRQSLDADAVYADVVVHGNGLTSLQYRAVKGGPTHEIQCAQAAASAVRLEKRGEYVQVSLQNVSGGFDRSGCVIRVPLRGAFLAGLVVCAHDEAGFEVAHFKHVAVGEPLPRRAEPLYALELVALDSLDRRIVFGAATRLEAPSFTADGEAICYRDDNRLYRLLLDDRSEPVEINADNVAECALAAASGTIAAENPPEAGRNGPAWLPRLSPDRSLIAYVFWKGRGEHGRPAAGDYLLRSAPFAGGAARDLARFFGDGGALGTAPWSPDGKRLVFVSREPG